jgi:hypothetical protein
MSSRSSYAVELLLLERYAAYCVGLAENCKHSQTAQFLRLLAVDFTMERDKRFRLLLGERAKREHSAKILKFQLLNNHRKLPQRSSPSPVLSNAGHAVDPFPATAAQLHRLNYYSSHA